jgi:undecaprenyl-diphosphatase
VILAVERYYKSWRVESVDDMTFRDALMIGLAQCCSLIPGVSRAGATNIGGMLCGQSRKAATEISFFLAVPTLIAAGGYVLLIHRVEFSVGDVETLAVGLIVSFVSALICIRWLLRYVASHTFNVFAWYRIILGVLILIVLW